LNVQVERLYSGKKTSGFRVVPPDGTPFFLKVFHHPFSLRKALSGLFLPARPYREYEFSRILREKGFPVPEVVSFYCKRLWGVVPVNVGYTRSVYLEGLVTLERLAGTSDFNGYFEKAVSLLGRLHRQGFVHRDASLSNFALYRGEIYLIDLEGVARVFPLLPFSRFRNFLNFLNDALKLGVKFSPERVLELYGREFKFSFGHKYLSSKLMALLRERKD